MPTPMAHMMVGSTIGLAFAPESKLKSIMQWSALGSVVSLFPDFDIVFTLTGAHWENVHRTATHSLVVVAIICSAIALTRRYRLALMIFVALSLHLLMDLFCQDMVPPYGLELFWPLWDIYVYPDIFIFFSVFTQEIILLPLSYFILVIIWEFFVHGVYVSQFYSNY